MTPIFSATRIIQDMILLLVGEAPTQNRIYPSMIQSIFDDKVVFNMYAQFAPLFPREGCRTLQIIEIEKYISIPRIIGLNQKIYSSMNDSSSKATFSSIGNSSISSAKTKDFLDLAD